MRRIEPPCVPWCVYYRRAYVYRLFYTLWEERGATRRREGGWAPGRGVGEVRVNVVVSVMLFVGDGFINFMSERGSQTGPGPWS